MLNKLKDYEFIVFAPEHYNTLDLIRSLGEAGIKPIYIAIKSRYKIASYSKYIKKLHKVNSIEEGMSYLWKYTNIEKKPFLYTIDDKTQAYLDTHYYELASSFTFFNCGAPNITSLFMDKWKILSAAKDCGFKILDTTMVKNGEIPEKIEYPIITKSISPIVGGWKSDVHICHNEMELLVAFTNIKSEHVLIQKYINKKNELCLDGYSVNHGEDVFIATQTTYNYNIAGYYSPYMTSEGFDPEVTYELYKLYNSLKELFKFIGFEGIFSVEFLIDEDGSMYFSEINFRHSTWSYVAAKNKMNLPVYWALSMLEKKNVCPQLKLKKNYTSMVEPVDYQKRVVEGNTSIFRWIYDLLTTNCKFYWNWKDLAPSIHMVLNNKVFR